MSDLTHEWRPAPRLRAIAIGLMRRDDRILLSAVTGDDGRVHGWRPLGGGIEFGETAEAALRRELREELGATVGRLAQRAVIENIFDHQGQPGHEIVFVFEGAFEEPGLAAADRFLLEDGGIRQQVGWIAVEAFRSGRERLFPDGLLGHL